MSPANTNDDSLDHDVLKATSSHNLFNDQESDLIGSRHVLLRGRPFNCVVTPWFEEFPDDHDFWGRREMLPCLVSLTKWTGLKEAYQHVDVLRVKSAVNTGLQ